MEAFCRAEKTGPTPFDLSLGSESGNPEGDRALAKAFIVCLLLARPLS